MEGALYSLRQEDGALIWRFDAEVGLTARSDQRPVK
jgi:outer membrane protein assembly factor BamB